MPLAEACSIEGRTVEAAVPAVAVPVRWRGYRGLSTQEPLQQVHWSGVVAPACASIRLQQLPATQELEKKLKRRRSSSCTGAAWQWYHQYEIAQCSSDSATIKHSRTGAAAAATLKQHGSTNSSMKSFTAAATKQPMHKERGAKAAATLKRRGSTSTRFNSTITAATVTKTTAEEVPQQQVHWSGVAVVPSAWNSLLQQRQCNNKAQQNRGGSSSYTEAAWQH